MESIFKEIRNNGKYTDQVGSFKIRNIRDLTTGICRSSVFSNLGYDSSKADKKAVLPTSSSTHMITFSFANGCVATLRGSGTEPKLKYYVELNGEDPEAVRKELDEVVDAIIHQLLQPSKNGLLPPKD